MLNIDESTVEIKKYFKKLENIIYNEACFSFITKKLYSKKRIDDLLCCIEATFPKEYKNHVKKHGKKSLTSYLNYQKLVDTLTDKFFLSSDHYIVIVGEVLHLPKTIMILIPRDFEHIKKSIETMS